MAGSAGAPAEAILAGAGAGDRRSGRHAVLPNAQGPARLISGCQILHAHLGTVVYEEALRRQRLLVSARLEDRVDDVLLTLEHDRVYTAGRHADLARTLLGTKPDIRVVEVDRGGDVTYHGPGQLVAYPILRLAQPRAVRRYVEALEMACVRVAASYGLTARPDRQRTGVWVGDRKLVAIGIRVEHGVTSHGLAFNVTTDLDDFAGIVPCGIADAGVCSLASLGAETTVQEVCGRLVAALATTLGRPVEPVDPAQLAALTAMRNLPGFEVLAT